MSFLSQNELLVVEQTRIFTAKNEVFPERNPSGLPVVGILPQAYFSTHKNRTL